MGSPTYGLYAMDIGYGFSSFDRTDATKLKYESEVHVKGQIVMIMLT